MGGTTDGALPRWASRGFQTGIIFGLPVLIAVVLVAALPALKFGSALALLPLLAVGPVAARGFRVPQGAAAAMLAGVISGVFAAGSLWLASVMLGALGLLAGPAGSPVSLARLAILPLTTVSLAPQDILFNQPLIALALGALTALPAELGDRASRLAVVFRPRSVRRALLLANGVLLVAILLVGWIGFSAIEERHVRAYLRPLHVDWKGHLDEIEAALDAEQAARRLGRDETPHVRTVRQTLALLADPAPHPDMRTPLEGFPSMQDRHGQSLSLLTAAYAAHRVRPDNPGVLQATRSALQVLRRDLDAALVAFGAADDLRSRHDLRMLMLVIGMAGAVGLGFRYWTVAVIDTPLRQAITHLSRVARGDYSRPAPNSGPPEFQALATTVDAIAADLNRLKAIERDALTAAEKKSVQGELLTRAGTALVAATDNDKIYQIAVRSALALARQPGHVRASLAVGPVHQMTVLAALGENASEALGARMDIRELMAGSSLELQQRQFKAFDLGMATVIAMLGFRPRTGAILLTTLRVRGGKLTMIMLESDGELADDCAEGLAKLGAEVALALDSSAFKEDMLVQRSEARFRSLVQNSTDIVMIVSPDGQLQYQSPSGERVLGYHDAALVGSYLQDLMHPDDVQKLQAFLVEVEQGSETTPRVEWRIRHADGSWVRTETTGNNLLSDPHVSGLVLNSRDIGDRRALQNELTYQAFHDPLTTLPNRALFMDRLEHALIRADRREQAVAMLFLDLDNFKIVNDSLGHQAGDQLLIEAAQRLLECVRTEDTVARLGGDEFTILMEDIHGLDSPLEVARRIEFKLRMPFTVVGHEVFTTASVGIAVSGPGVGSAADLLRDADLAMYRAKSEGKARHVVYDGAMNTQAMKRLELETALRRAVERRELRLMYQPIMSLESMGIDRVETLVRWQHPERGLVSPADFIPVAEETGLIVPIGQWVLREACRQAMAWQREFPSAPDLVMSVNLSPRQFQHHNLLEDISSILFESGLDPEFLELEITEGAVMEDANAAREIMQKLRDIGISLAIDDFGTGYSSLSYLKRFPVSVLKIDQSFVRGLGQDDQDSAIVRGVIALAQSLNLTVTAEGIETLEQLAQLRQLGCNHGQGYLLSRPLTGEAIGNLLARSTVRLPSPKHGILRDRRAAS